MKRHSLVQIKVFSKNTKYYTFKIHLLSLWKINQTNVSNQNKKD